MIYRDKVYGKVVFKEKVLADLIESKPIRRLKGVNQAGPFVFLNSDHEWKKFRTTRFDHSVGVCVLLRKLNSSLEEQIAGLLHDVSHMVFSHVVDFLFHRGTMHDYHETFHEAMILNSRISSILKKHGLDVRDILDNKRYTLLEKEMPDLCADRIDYFLRFMLEYGRISEKEIHDVLDALLVYGNEVIFSNRTQADFFAKKYIEANIEVWCNPLQASLFHVISETLRIAISRGIITQQDLFTTDSEVMSKLRNSNDERIENLLDLLRGMEIVEDENDYDLHLASKVRYTDPKILIGGKVFRLSEIDRDYESLMKDYIAKRSKGFFVRIRKARTQHFHNI